jgi:hypothetical protein
MQSGYSDLLSRISSQEKSCAPSAFPNSFFLPLIATTTAQATALQGVLQKLQIFKKQKTLVAGRREGGEGVRTSDSEQFGGDDLVTDH